MEIFFLYNIQLVFEEYKILAYLITWYKSATLSEAHKVIDCSFGFL